MIALKPLDKDMTRTKAGLQYLTGTEFYNGADHPLIQRYDPMVMPGFRNGFSNPDWRNKVRRKEDATTPLELRVDSCEYHNISDTYDCRFAGNFGYKAQYKVTAIPPPVVFNQNDEFPVILNQSWDCVKQAQNIALAYKRKYVDEQTQPFQSQIFLGEIKETIDFIRHPFGKLSALANSAKAARYNASLKHYRQAAVKYRGGVFEKTSEARLLLNDIADAWFEVRFALLPLVSDVTAALGVINGRTSEKRSSFRGDASQTDSPQRTDWSFQHLAGQRLVEGSLLCHYFINTGIIFDDTTNYTGFPEYLEKTTSELVNFIPTIYEITPGSWLVDYFVNVGDYLNTIATSSKVSLSYDCRTTVVEYTKRYSFEPALVQQPGLTLDSLGLTAHMIRTRKYISRKIGTDSFPSVAFSFPTGMPELTNTALYLSRKFSNILR